MDTAQPTPAPGEHDEPRSDEQLLRQYCDAADMEAFERLVHRYEKQVYNYLVRYLRDAELAEDVFQATFVRLHEKCKQFQFGEGRRLRPWLYSIATHEAIDALRREGRHRSASLDDQQPAAEAARSLADLLRAATPSPSDLAEEHERADWTRQAVDALPEHQRAAILLVFFQGLKYQEAAEALDIPVGTVKSRIHKALLALNEAWHREHRQE